MKDKAYSRLIWKYNLGNYKDLVKCLKEAPWCTLDIFDNIDDTVDYFHNLLLKTCYEFIPTKNVIIRPQDKPWMTNEVRKKFRIRNRAHRNFKHSPSQENLLKY